MMPAHPDDSRRSQLFLSYRREDSSWAATTLYHGLVGRLGVQGVFRDVDEFERLLPGSDFRRVVEVEVARSFALLALIGDRWVNAAYREGPHEGRRRLDDPEDLVRVEIETAFAHGVRVIPVIVGEQNQPPAYDDLPSGPLRALASRHAAFVRPSAALDPQLRALLDLVERARDEPHLEWEPARDREATVTVSLGQHRDLPDRAIELHRAIVPTFGQLADEVWVAAEDRLSPYTYGRDWVLRDAATGRTIEHTRMLHRIAPGTFVADTRSLAEVGIVGGATLEVVHPDDINAVAEASVSRT
jgi:hypothetical protein